MSGEGSQKIEDIETITKKIPNSRQMRIPLRHITRGTIKQGDVVHVRIKNADIERDVLTRVQTLDKITIPKMQLGKEASEKIVGKIAELRLQVVPPAESTDLVKEGQIDLREVVSRLGGYVVGTNEGVKIDLEDGRGGMRTLLPQDIQMDIKQFFENVGRNMADSDGTQGLSNMDPKMINEYIEYLKVMGIHDLSYSLQIASHHELSDEEKQEYLRHRILINPELPENTPVQNRIFEPTENPKRNPIGTAKIAKGSDPLRQIHNEAIKIVREAVDGKFHPDICRQISQSFIRGAVGGDGGVDVSKEGKITITYSELDPEIRALVRDAIKAGYDVTMNEYPELGQLRITQLETIKELAKQGFVDANALRAARLYAELIQQTEGAERKEFEKKLQELKQWLRLYINVVRELVRILPDSVVPKWREFINLLEDVLPPEDISIRFRQSPTGS